MSAANDIIDAVIVELDSLKKNLKKKITKQIQSLDEKALLKATASAWFKSHREKLVFLGNALNSVDETYHQLLSAGDKNPSRDSVQGIIKNLRADFTKLRKNAIQVVPTAAVNTSDTPPDFSPLVSAVGMQSVLSRRWNECSLCVKNNTPLAATVMIGGLLEGLLLAKINQETDQSKIYKATSAPIEKKSGKPKAISDWTLSDFINLAFELKWITKPAKDIGTVLREYRNYIHPHKEFSNNLSLQPGDATLFWEIAKNITRQLLE